MQPHLSDSAVQQEVEPVCLQLASAALKVHLTPSDIRLADGTLFRVDGVNETERVLCEIFSHVGNMRDGQRKKLAKICSSFSPWRTPLGVSGGRSFASSMTQLASF